MNIESYLLAKRTNYVIIESIESRYPKTISLIKRALNEEGLKFILIRSSDCESEIVRLGETKWVIIDIQAELYMNSLSIPSIISESGTEEFKDSMFAALTFVACNELHYRNKAKLARHIHSHYSSSYSFNQPNNPFSSMARLFYIVFHEWGHDIADNKSNILDDILIEVDDVFKELVTEQLNNTYSNNNFSKNLYYQTTFQDLFNKNNRIECAVDTISAIQTKITINDDKMFGASIGGFSGYLHSALICIHQMTIIREVQSMVQCAIDGIEYKTLPEQELNQRIRITRYLFSRLLVDELGMERAEISWNKFTKYMAPVSGKNLNELLNQVHRVILSNKDTFSEVNNEIDSEYCINEFSWK